jgi:DNA-directed RNA polymerase subunit beta'
LSYLLGLSTKNLERIIYYEVYVIIEPGASGREMKELIDEDEFLELDTKYGFYAATEEERYKEY